MNNTATPRKKTIISPKWQAIVFGGTALILMLGASLIAKEPNTIWLISSTMLLLFSMLNHVQSLGVSKYGQYLQQSLVAFVSTFIALGLGSTLLSGTSIFDAGHYRIIYIIILVSFFFFMGMIMLMKSFLLFLQKKDEKMK